MKFKRIRTPLHVLVAKKASLAVADEPEQPFRQQLIDQMDKNLPVIFDKETEKQLHTRFTLYAGLIDQIKNNYHGGLDIPELGIKWPLKPSSSPRQDRQRVRDLIEVLNMVRAAVANEMVNPPLNAIHTSILLSAIFCSLNPKHPAY
jgi:hypothetical protein